jgi:hypothetical protein
VDCAQVSGLWTADLSDQLFSDEESDDSMEPLRTGSTASVVPVNLNNDNNATRAMRWVTWGATVPGSKPESQIIPAQAASSAGQVYIIDDMEL